jgi:hypothetical protein
MKNQETQNEGTQTGKDYYIFQRELSGYVLERNGIFVPKWLCFFNGYTPEQLLIGNRKIVARAYTEEEMKERFDPKTY